MKKLFQKLKRKSKPIHVMEDKANNEIASEHLQTNLSKEFKPLFEDHIDAVIKLSASGELLDWNKAFIKQFGYKAKEVLRNALSVILKNEEHDHQQYFEEALSGKTASFYALGIRKNGETIDLHVTYIPVKASEGVKSVYAMFKDITALKETERELLLFKKNLNAVENMGNIGSFHYDIVNDCSYFSKQNRVIFGVSENEDFSPTYEQFLQFVHPDDRFKFDHAVQHLHEKKGGYYLEHRVVRRDGTIRYVCGQADMVLDENGQPARVVGFIHDITSSKMTEKELMEKEHQFSQIYNALDTGIWSVNMRTQELLLYSKGIEQICGYSFEEMRNRNLWVSIIHEEDVPQYLERQPDLLKGNVIRHHYRIIHKNGEVKWIQDYTIPVLNSNGTLIRLDGLISDITEQKILNEKITYLSYHDYLTDLPNRRLFDEKLQQWIGEFADSEQKFAVMLLDIDRFKYINDTLGHPIGDELLQQISARLSPFLTNDDVLSRLGGDEFGILLTNAAAIEAPVKAAQKMIDSLKKPFFVQGYELYVTASIGISLFPDDGGDSDQLLRNADIALYKAKEFGKSSYQIFSASMNIESFKLFTLGRDLRKALNANEMCLYYQPRVDTHSGKITSAEALIRWNHPKWGLVLPSEFIPIAEENGLITDLEDWVLQEVCRQLKEWKTKGIWTVPISINISAIHFMKQDWLQTVERTIHETGVDPTDLEFEITESVLLNNEDIVKNTVQIFKKMGIKVSLDDFGTGYSSLSYLAKFPFDVIKIDKSFVQNMIDHEQDLFIAKSIIHLAKGLQLKVVAEGVETLEQLKLLRKEQCQQIQGYLFSRPVPVEQFEVLLRKKVLQPTEPILQARKNKRRYERIHLLSPLLAQMTLVSFGERTMHLGKSSVWIENISEGGLRYRSSLKLPVREDIILKFDLHMLGKDIEVNGRIIWREEVNGGMEEYGIEFIMEDSERETLAALLKTYSILEENNISTPSGKMVMEKKQQS